MTSDVPVPSPSTAVVVLAGGGSRRMGRDKALLEADFGSGTESLLEHTLGVAARLGLPVILAAGDRPERVDPSLLERIGEICGRPPLTCSDVPGGVPGGGQGGGPAAGILGAAEVAPASALLVLACDLPFLTDLLPRRLLALAGDEPVDAVVPIHGTRATRATHETHETHATHGGRLHPLAAWYGPAALEVLERRVAAGALDLVGLLAQEPERRRHGGGSMGLRVLHADAHRLGIEPLRLERELFNCNEPGDWELVRQRSGPRTPSP